MSFITLKSEYQDNYIGGSESAATFTNYFESPIELGMGNTLQLVSCSIKKTLGYNIVEGVNDTLLWRIGPGAQALGGPTPFYQHDVILTPGNYTGTELAVEIAVQINDSTVLGMFKGLWDCTYTEPPGGGIGTDFTITWAQSTLPVSSEEAPIQGQLFTPVANGRGILAITPFTNINDVYFPAGLNIPGMKIQFSAPLNINQGALLRQLNTNWLEIKASAEDWPYTTPITQNLAFGVPLLGQLGNRSIYANGGNVAGIMRPVCKVANYNFNRPAGPSLTIDTIRVLNYNNALGLTETLSMTPLVADPGGWMYQVAAPLDKVGAIESVIFKPGLNGIVEMSQVIPVGGEGSGFVEGDIGVIQTDPPRGPEDGSLATFQVGSVTGTGQILNFNLRSPGEGYLGVTTVTLVNSRVGELSATGTITKIQPSTNAVGSLYIDGDTYPTTLTTDGGAGTGATVKVLTTDGDGGILTFEIVDRGEGYLTFPERDTILVDGPTTSASGNKISSAELIITQRSLGFPANVKAVVLSDGTLGIGSGIFQGPAPAPPVPSDAVESNFDFGTFLMQTTTGDYRSTAFLLQTEETTGQSPSNFPPNQLMQIELLGAASPATGGVANAKIFRAGGLGGICRADLDTPGTGYAVNDTGTLVIPAGSGQTGSGATYIIDSVQAFGEINTFTVIDPGKTYQGLNTYDFIPGGNQPGVGINGKLLIIQEQTQPAARGEGYTVSNAQPTEAIVGTGSGFEINILALGSAGGVTDFISGAGSIASGGVGYNVGDEMVILKGGIKANGMAVITVTQASPIVPGGGGAVTELDIVYDLTYPATQVAYIRNELSFGSTDDNFNINRRYSYRPGEADLQVTLTPNLTNTALGCTVVQLNETEGLRYPESGWRAPEEMLNLPDIATAFSTAGQAGYIYGKSTVKAEIVIDAIRNITVNLYQNGAGSDNDPFLAAVPVSTSGVLAGNIKYRPHEAHYPLRPFVSCATSLPFLPGPLSSPTMQALIPYSPATNGGLTENIIGGVYDIQDTAIPLSRQTFATPGNILADALPLPVAAPAQSLPCLLKSQSLDSSDTYTPPTVGTTRTISTFDLIPNTANAGRLMSYFPVYNIEAASTVGSFSSDPGTAPEYSADKSTILVELPDFNITSYSGESGDRGRAVGVIPTEEFATNTETGTLHFQSNYPRPIELNLPFSKPFYSIECRLRNLDGTVVDNLENSTEVVLLVGETDESKQQRIMDKSMERLGGLMANNQDAKISAPVDGSLGI